MERGYVTYGFRKDAYSFLVLTNFDSTGYQYTQKCDGVIFWRQWGDRKFCLGTHLFFHNMDWYVAGPTKGNDYWTLKCHDEPNSRHMIIEREQDLFTCTIKVNGEITYQNTIDLHKRKTVDKDLLLRNCIAEIMQKNGALYERIHDKATFDFQLQMLIKDYIDDPESGMLEDTMADSSTLFKDFIQSEKVFLTLKGTITKEFLLQKFSDLISEQDEEILEPFVQYINSILAPFIEGPTEEDFLADIKNEFLDYKANAYYDADRLAEQAEFDAHKSQYTVEYFSQRHADTIQKVFYKEEFFEQLKSEIEKDLSYHSTESFLSSVDSFIASFAWRDNIRHQIELFVEQNGTYDICIDLTPDKENLYEHGDPLLFSEQEKKEYEFYQKAKQAYQTAMYRKNSKLLKPSFQQIPHFIEAFLNLLEKAKATHIFTKHNDLYVFDSFDKIQQFAKLVDAQKI